MIYLRDFPTSLFLHSCVKLLDLLFCRQFLLSIRSTSLVFLLIFHRITILLPPHWDFALHSLFMIPIYIKSAFINCWSDRATDLFSPPPNGWGHLGVNAPLFKAVLGCAGGGQWQGKEGGEREFQCRTVCVYPWQFFFPHFLWRQLTEACALNLSTAPLSKILQWEGTQFPMPSVWCRSAKERYGSIILGFFKSSNLLLIH